MKTEVYLGIAIRIIVLFTIGALATFIPEHLRDFFGDSKFTPYTVGGSSYSFLKEETGSIDTQWYWGVRHYWYFNMMLLLFILSIINIVVSIVNLVNKHYKFE